MSLQSENIAKIDTLFTYTRYVLKNKNHMTVHKLDFAKMVNLCPFCDN